MVKHAKLLGLNISSDLKWNFHVSEIVRKVASRLYLLRQLKRANADSSDLLQFYTTCIRPVTEYCCQAFHDSLPNYLSDELERLQKRALRIIFPFISYTEALQVSNLTTAYSRRQSLTQRLFKKIANDKNHSLHHLLPKTNNSSVSLRRRHKFTLPFCKTKRFQSSFFIANAAKWLD